MAQLHIERERRTAWPWMLAILLLLLLAVWFLFWRDPAPTDALGAVEDAAPALVTDGAATAAPASDGLPTAVETFTTFVEERSAGLAADETHEYAATGLRNLSAALGAVAAWTAPAADDLQPQLDSLRLRADQLQREPASGAHANQVRQAFLNAAGVLQMLQERAYPTLADQVSEVQQAATAIDGGRLLLDQTAGMQRFFEDAAGALQAMAAARTT